MSMEMGTPVTRRRGYGPMKKTDDAQQTQQNQDAKKTKQKKNDSIYKKDSNGNPQITDKGKAKSEKNIDDARKEADRDHDKFMNDMFGDCF